MHTFLYEWPILVMMCCHSHLYKILFQFQNISSAHVWNIDSTRQCSIPKVAGKQEVKVKNQCECHSETQKAIPVEIKCELTLEIKALQATQRGLCNCCLMLIPLACISGTCTVLLESFRDLVAGAAFRQKSQEKLRLPVMPPQSQSPSALLTDRLSSLDNAHEKEHGPLAAVPLFLRFNFLTSSPASLSFQ